MLRVSRPLCIGLLFFAIIATASPVCAQIRPSSHDSTVQVLTLEQSVSWALQHNPELAVFRQQRGIASAGVVIAKTYPFNPVWGSAVLGVSPSPGDNTVTNRVFNQHTLTQEVEVRGQGGIRGNAAAAALSRVEWEIAMREQQTAIRAIRAFQGFLYQQQKLQLLDETIRLQGDVSEKAERLMDQGKLKAADLMLTRADEVDSRSQRGSRQTQVVAAWHEVRKVMGVQNEVVEVKGKLTPTVPSGSVEHWMQFANQQRPDLKAIQMAYVEAEQRERLEVANRFGNPTIGLKTEYNESRTYFLGPTVQFPVPIFNRNRGQILQRQAEKTAVLLDKRRVEIQIQQDVLAATDRLKEANKWVASFDTDILPILQKSMDAFDKLFAQGEPSVDVLRLIEIRRRYLRARDGYLDALWELSQARADLAAAVGDFSLAFEEVVPMARFGTPE